MENYCFLNDMLYKGKRCTDEPGNYRGILIYQFPERYFLGTLFGRLRDWRVNHKMLLLFQAGFDGV
jgi:hypothetical protein